MSEPTWYQAYDYDRYGNRAESVIDEAGGKQVVQKAYDAANALVHYDPKK